VHSKPDYFVVLETVAAGLIVSPCVNIQKVDE